MKAVPVPTRSKSLLPESVRNLIESVNCASRIVLRTCEGTERTVEGLDQVATLMLRKQRNALLAELEEIPMLEQA